MKKFLNFLFSAGGGEVLEETFATEVWDFETGNCRTIEPNLSNNANSAEVWEGIAIYFVGPNFCDSPNFAGYGTSTMSTTTPLRLN